MPFEKGQSGNPNGRPKMSLDDKMTRVLKRWEFERIATRLMEKNIDELKAFMKEPQATMLELIVARVLIKALEGGDQSRLDFMLNRTIGRVPEKIQVVEDDPEEYQPPSTLAADEKTPETN